MMASEIQILLYRRLIGCGQTSGYVQLTRLSEDEVSGKIDSENIDLSALTNECGGTQISDQIILTAAHCVVIGNVNAARSGDFVVGVHSNFTHPKFDNTAYNNIAVIKLDVGINTLNKSPPCISDGDYDTSGREATYEGHGSTSKGIPSEILKKETVTILANDICADKLRAKWLRHLINKRKIKSRFPEGVTDDIICTIGNEVSANTCKSKEFV